MLIHLLAAGPDWGSVPEWIAAGGTLAAFFVALRLLAKELVVRREAEEDRRRDQARMVSAWSFPELTGDAAPLKLDVYIMVRNGSDEPVHDVRITLVPKDSPFAADPEQAREKAPWKAYDWDLLPPGGPIKVFIDFHSSAPVVLGLTFTDSQGRRWRRVGGTLTEVTSRRRRSRKDYMNAWIAGELDDLDY
jgi:hypothetical protein